MNSEKARLRNLIEGLKDMKFRKGKVAPTNPDQSKCNSSPNAAAGVDKLPCINIARMASVVSRVSDDISDADR